MDIHEITKSGLHYVMEPLGIPSGTHLRAEPGARLTGGVKLTPDAYENGVYMCDLKKAGIKPSPIPNTGFGRPTAPSNNELFINGEMLYLSRYPKKDKYLTITGYGKGVDSDHLTDGRHEEDVGRLDSGYYYDDERPSAWRMDQDIHAFGYWARDWAPTSDKIESLDVEKKFAKNCPPYGAYGFNPGQRFYFFNIIEEVTEPGDYCIDYQNEKLYFIPWENTDMDSAEIILSVSDKPALILENVEDITIEGFTIGAFRGNGIIVRNCRNITIKDCTIRNIGETAVSVQGCQNVNVENCLVYNTGCSGITMSCGDRETLTPGNCAVRNCHLYNIAHSGLCYLTPINLSGVGLSAVGNCIHDCPHTGVLYYGNDITIENNEIYDVLLKTGDAGAVYSGRDYTCRGNRVCGNFIHHVGSGIGMGTMGIYNDDCLSGTIMNNNVFYKAQRAVLIGGGVDFEIKGNVFVDCYPSIEIDGRGQSDDFRWRNNMNIDLRGRFYRIAADESGVKEPYKSRYPELEKIHEYFQKEEDTHIPPSAVMEDNIFCSDQKISYGWCTTGGDFVEINNQDITIDELKNYVTAHQLTVIMEDYGK